MALERPRFFTTEPGEVRQIAPGDLLSIFNDGVIGLANSLEPAPSMEEPISNFDLGESPVIEFARNDERRSFLQRQDDEALFLSRQSAGSAALTVGGSSPIPDFSADEFTAPEQPVGEYTGSRDLLTMVKGLEGFNPKAYGDFKQTSIGYGTRAKKGETSISKENAEARLRSELASHRKRVVDHAAKHGYEFSPGQLDALTSFDFNTGRIEQLTNGGKRSIQEIGSKIGAYNKAGGKVLPGLVKRRRTEQQLFNQG